MSADAWIFGYGSLVSPASMATTIGRTVADADVVVAQLDGYGRRWNYGSMHLRGDWHHDGVTVRQGLVVSLGLVASDSESCNGVIVRVTADELAMLDWRERDYERTDVTDTIRRVDHVHPERVMTYVPRPSAIDRYETARDRRQAGIRQSYWELVTAAFSNLGGDHLERYAATPAPDVPVVDMTLSMLEDS
ncbi:MAG TPA: gamma-glutamylcyclotransferase family protein [Ilumatobacteraceae bacterium]|nr:gamma-glutamylcyclotransferase family protein [Ilumatobacteraceae bacterium]